MLNRAREWWEGLGRSNQVMFVATSLAVVIALVGFVAWASTPEYVPLFSNLSAQDAVAITDKLKESGVPYHLIANGSAVEVPAQKRDEMHMKLAGMGLPMQPSATLGYELYKESTMGQTSTMEGQNILRAHEGEIAKSIMYLDQVGNVVVHVAPADDSPFSSDKKPAKASVVLTLKPGQMLSEENVRAIVRLVQMSYTGLSEDNISVVDSRGGLLHDPMRVGTDGTDDRHKQEIALAQSKREMLQAALDRTVGVNRTFVIVNAELSSDKKVIKSTASEPGAAIETTTEKEELKGSVTPDATAPGIAANAKLPGVPDYVKDAKTGNGNYTHEIKTKKAAPSVTETTTNTPAGKLEKLSVSALVDTKVPAEQVAAIKSTLMTAIGAAPNDVSRMVTVEQVPFDHTAEEEEAKAASAARNADTMARMLSMLVPLVLMMGSLLLLYRSLRKTKPAFGGGQLALAGAGGGSYGMDADAIAIGPDGMPLPGQTVESILGGPLDPIGLSAGGSEPRTFEIIEETFDAHLESIQHLVRSKPETVAALIRGWTTEEV